MTVPRHCSTAIRHWRRSYSREYLVTSCLFVFLCAVISGTRAHVRKSSSVNLEALLHWHSVLTSHHNVSKHSTANSLSSDLYPTLSGAESAGAVASAVSGARARGRGGVRNSASAVSGRTGGSRAVALQVAAGPQTGRKRAAAPKQSGPCSPIASAAVISVIRPSDIRRRLRFPPTRTVILNVAANLPLSSGLLFDSRYACTIMRGTKPNLVVSYAGDDQPILRIWGTHNVLVYDLNFWIGVRASSPVCQDVFEIRKKVNCAALHVHQSFGVQLARGKVYGRIDLIRTMNSRVDSMTVTGTSGFESSPGVIRVFYSGYGPGLVRSNILISNNEVYGVHTPIVLYNGAVGVTVRNNYVHDYVFTGIRCGADVSYQGDCMLTSISRNIVINRKVNSNGDYDSAGIYWCTHWINPGNTAECNYVIGGDHCYYLDYASSGIHIKGGACINNRDGVKVNNGKKNVVTGLILKDVAEGYAVWCTCLTVEVDNCRSSSGRYWEYMRQKYYNTPAINRNWPWLKQICQQTHVNGRPCNPRRSLASSKSAACSGLATENTLDLISVSRTKLGLGYYYCENVTSMHTLNRHTYLNWTSPVASIQFLNYRGNNLGVTKSSPIFRLRPKFHSCDRRSAGPQRIRKSVYLARFNVPRPLYFNLVRNMTTDHVHDSEGRQRTLVKS